MPSGPARSFAALHRPSDPLLLPNAWDVASARIIEAAGAKAIATTSSGLCWALGVRDGNAIPRSQAVAAVRRIVDGVLAPVTADIEGGYGDRTAEDVSETVRAMVDAGVVGINLEDTPGSDGAPILTPQEQAQRIAAAREAAQSSGVDLFINARTDVFLRAVGDPEHRLDATLERAEVYLDAGASGIFVPGLTDAETVRALANGIRGPLNIMSGPGKLSLDELAALGVARISLGPALALAAYGRVRKMARELIVDGKMASLETDVTFGNMQDLFPDA
ncbi:MAG: isocitrate lyase/phosphoenolpyruvate mutase family protein [Bacteroidota bacterium]